MKSKLTSCFLILVILFASCKKDVQEQGMDTPAGQDMSERAAGPAAKGSTVYLQIIVENGYELQHDANGDTYVHGIDKVDARILSSDGNLYFQTNTTDQKEPVRSLVFASPGNYSDFNMNNKRNYTIRTNVPASGTWLQNMAPGSSQELGLAIRGIDAGGSIDWLLQYRNGITANDLNTDLVRVSRSSDGNTWILEPAGSSTAPATAGLYDSDSNGNAILPAEGTNPYHAVPFRIVLSRK